LHQEQDKTSEAKETLFQFYRDSLTETTHLSFLAKYKNPEN
jgi:hypothetical protein